MVESSPLTYNKVFIPNEIFGRDIKTSLYPPFEKISATDVIKVIRIKAPFLDDIVDFIKYNTKSFEGSTFVNESESSKFSEKIFSLLETISENEIKKIIEGDNDVLNHIRIYLPENSLKENKPYLLAMGGIVPNYILDSVEIPDNEEKSLIYDNLLILNGKNIWKINMKLSDGWNLPNSSELEYLIRKEVRDSDVFSVIGNFDNYEEIADKIRFIYKKFNSPLTVKQIPNVSYAFLESSAIFTLEGFAKCLASEERIFGMMSNLCEQVFGMNQYRGEKNTPKSQEEHFKKPHKNLDFFIGK